MREGDDKDVGIYRETLRQVINRAIPLQLQYLSLLNAAASQTD